MERKNYQMTGIAGMHIGEVDGVWVPDEGVRLSALKWDGSMQRLKGLLFGGHEASWYGGEITSHRMAFGEGLLISPLLAMDYLSSPKPVRLLGMDWSPRLQVLMGYAALIRRALLAGWFAPDLSIWSKRDTGWKLMIPDSETAAKAEWKRLAQAAAEFRIQGVEQWLDMAVEEVIAQEDGAGGALANVLLRTGANLSGKSALDEEDWLVAIGWKRDDVPFRISLQLAEPTEETGWRLGVMLQDKDEPNGWLRIRRTDSGWEPEQEQLPASWEPLLKPRLLKEEEKWLRVLPDWEDGAGSGRLRIDLSEQEAWYFLEEGSVSLLQAGCSVLLPGWWEAVRNRKLRLKAKVKSSVGSSEQPMFGLDQIVEFDWKLAVGDLDLTEAEFMRLAGENRRLMRVRDQWVHLDPSDINQLQAFIKKTGKKKGLSFREVLEMHLRGGADADQGLEEADIQTEVELNEHLTKWLEQLQHTSELPLVNKPAAFLGDLRPYQLEGVSWLVFLRRFGLGGCLADDMGLGKTIQFTAYLLHIKAQLALASSGQSDAPLPSPSLLICPTSVIGNWEKELERFAPSLQVYIHYGPKRSKGEAFREAVEGADLVVTSYALAPLDEEELASIEWSSLCLDEAQNIKNVYTKQSSAIRRFPALHRIAMTGTPMENRLTELWSIHDFMNPGYLGNLSEFRREVVQPIERTRDEDMIRQLQQWVRPFMLRREKNDPAIRLSLPDKIEQKTYVSLTAEQGALYENTVNDLLEKLDTLSPMQRRGLILATLTKLKQMCDHPSLVLKDEPKGVAAWDNERSGKVVRLLEMVEEIAAEGERCLIFTQFVDIGRMLQSKLEQMLGIPVPYLYGAVPKQDRDTMIETFQDASHPGCAFVLSLKAGGTGLNLTAANHVFHFDRWWNPAVENQATDRAFRIGQTRNVQVHKFVTIGTLEERIDEMISRKQALNEQVVGRSENWITELSTDELKAMFTLRKTWLNG
jgi:SNF2 family DNA or RNA helicase